MGPFDSLKSKYISTISKYKLSPYLGKLVSVKLPDGSLSYRILDTHITNEFLLDNSYCTSLIYRDYSRYSPKYEETILTLKDIYYGNVVIRQVTEEEKLKLMHDCLMLNKEFADNETRFKGEQCYKFVTLFWK